MKMYLFPVLIQFLSLNTILKCSEFNIDFMNIFSHFLKRFIFSGQEIDKKLTKKLLENTLFKAKDNDNTVIQLFKFCNESQEKHIARINFFKNSIIKWLNLNPNNEKESQVIQKANQYVWLVNQFENNIYIFTKNNELEKSLQISLIAVSIDSALGYKMHNIYFYRKDQCNYVQPTHGEIKNIIKAISCFNPVYKGKKPVTDFVSYAKLCLTKNPDGTFKIPYKINPIKDLYNDEKNYENETNELKVILYNKYALEEYIKKRVPDRNKHIEKIRNSFKKNVTIDKRKYSEEIPIAYEFEKYYPPKKNTI
mgnify:CR=1 FL=1